MEAIAEAAQRAQAAGCRTSDCEAIITIHGILKIRDDQFDNEINDRGAILDNGQAAIAHRRLENLLFRHRQLYGPVCAMAVKILLRIHLASNEDALPVGVEMMEDAVDMDLRDHGHCAADLVAALPRDPANDRIRINSEVSCLGDPFGRRDRKAACDALAAGAVDRGDD